MNKKSSTTHSSMQLETPPCGWRCSGFSSSSCSNSYSATRYSYSATRYSIWEPQRLCRTEQRYHYGKVAVAHPSGFEYEYRLAPEYEDD